MHVVSSALSMVISMLLDCIDRHRPGVVLSVRLRIASTVLMPLFFHISADLAHINTNMLTLLYC